MPNEGITGFGYWDESNFYRMEGFSIQITTIDGRVLLVPRILELPGLTASQNLINCDVQVDCAEWRMSAEIAVPLAAFEVFRADLERIRFGETSNAAFPAEPHCRELRPQFELTVREGREFGRSLLCECAVAVPDLQWESRPEGQRQDHHYRRSLATSRMIMQMEPDVLPTTCDQISALCRHLRDV